MTGYDEPLFQQVVAYAADADRDVVGMVSGDPDWGPPPSLREGLHEAADASADDLQYPPSPGLPELRDLLAARHGVSRRRVLVTAGATEAVSLGVARALSDEREGDEVVVVDPTYPYYPAQARLHGGRVRRVAAAPDGGLDEAAVREAVGPETAGVVLNDPNNPTGAVYDPDATRAVLETAADHDALLVRDEVYDAFDLSGRFESALALDAPDPVVVSAASKTFAVTGLRVGWAVVPECHVDALQTRHLLTTISASRPAQVAVARALRETGEAYADGARSRLRERRDRFCAALDAVGADYLPPRGGFYVLADLPGVAGDLASVERLIDDAGVAGMPGDAFGAGAEGRVRFSLTTARVDEAGARLRAHLG
ncbi:MAG: aspartate/tyrosine/aromatic aminotransferase [uncultured archaeon A07HB70]|nr:MAG: aspartate/tyrosine/aromatic aminotransferase [uncultured archaeon A07HB70]